MGRPVLSAYAPLNLEDLEWSILAEITQEEATRTLSFDAMVHLEEITPELMSYLEKMQPYGVGNPEPILYCRDFQVVNLRILKGNHLQLRLRKGEAYFDAIGFNLVDSDQPPPPPEWLLFSPRWNHWRGERRLQLHLHDYK